MVSVFDVVKYILSRYSEKMTAMKLQKLVYYCQAWSLAWDGKPLFGEKIYAWSNGPVVRELYSEYKGQYIITKNAKGDVKKLSDEQKQTIEAVLKYYGNKSPQWLSDLTHMEDPWKIARVGLLETDRGFQEISLASMEEYYSSLSKS